MPMPFRQASHVYAVSSAESAGVNELLALVDRTCLLDVAGLVVRLVSVSCVLFRQYVDVWGRRYCDLVALVFGNGRGGGAS